MSDWTRHLNLKRWETSPDPHFKTLLVILWIFVAISLPAGWIISRTATEAFIEMSLNGEDTTANGAESSATYTLIKRADLISDLLHGVFSLSVLGIASVSFLKRQHRANVNNRTESRES